MALIPSFGRFPDEAAIIGELILAYGELEVITMLTLAKVLRDQRTAIKTLYCVRSEGARADIAYAIMQKPFEDVGLKDDYQAAHKALRWCRKVRNQYAHTQWEDWKERGLGFFNLEEIAEGRQSARIRLIDLALLRQQKQYFLYTKAFLDYLEWEYAVRAGLEKLQIFAKPAAVQRPSLYNLPSEDVPPHT